MKTLYSISLGTHKAFGSYQLIFVMNDGETLMMPISFGHFKKLRNFGLAVQG